MSKYYFLYLIFLFSQLILIKANSIWDYSHDKGEPLSIQAGSFHQEEELFHMVIQG